jgi:hypothetical protein
MAVRRAVRQVQRRDAAVAGEVAVAIVVTLARARASGTRRGGSGLRARGEELLALAALIPLPTPHRLSKSEDDTLESSFVSRIPWGAPPRRSSFRFFILPA